MAAVASASPPTNLKEALASLRSSIDEYRCEVALKGNEDGAGIVSTNKLFLAAWSPVFRTMFDSQFIEASASTIQTSYSSQVLELLVEFCTFDIVSPLEDSAEEQGGLSEALVRKLMSLADAANYYEIQGLKTRINHWFSCQLLDEKKRMLTPWLPSFLLEESLNGTELFETAMQAIRMNPRETLVEPMPGGENQIRPVSVTSMETILSDDSLRASEYLVFKLLRSWAKASPENTENAKQLADRIDVSRFPTEYLLGDASDLNILSEKALKRASDIQCLVLFNQVGGTDCLNSLSKLKRAEFCGAPLVTVKGAGKPEVNGLFVAVSNNSGSFSFSFSKKIWRGTSETVVFFILQYAEPGDGSKGWVLGVSDRSGNFTTLYFVIGGRHHIPQEGWQAISPELGTAPSVHNGMV